MLVCRHPGRFGHTIVSDSDSDSAWGPGPAVGQGPAGRPNWTSRPLFSTAMSGTMTVTLGFTLSRLLSIMGFPARGDAGET